MSDVIDDQPSQQPAVASDVFVVIPTYNEERHIEDCIRSLMGDATDMHDVAIIVADGGSGDKTVEIVESMQQEFANLTCLHNPRKIQSAAINIAAQQAPAERSIMVRCDAHSHYPPGFVMKVAQKLREVGAQSVVVPMDAVSETDSCFQKANAWIVDSPLGNGGAAHRGGRSSGWIDHGHHAAFDRATFLRLGGYDENFAANEDAEYDQRVANDGGRVWIEADARIEYFPRKGFRKLWKQYFGYAKGRAMNLRKHGAKPRIRAIIPLINLIGLIANAVALMFWGQYGGQIAATTGIPEALGYIVFGVQPVLFLGVLILTSLVGVVKLASLCGAFAGPVLAGMYLSHGFGFIQGWFMTPRPDQTDASLTLQSQPAE